jgi:hypothetical protein
MQNTSIAGTRLRIGAEVPNLTSGEVSQAGDLSGHVRVKQQRTRTALHELDGARQRAGLLGTILGDVNSLPTHSAVRNIERSGSISLQTIWRTK